MTIDDSSIFLPNHPVATTRLGHHSGTVGGLGHASREHRSVLERPSSAPARRSPSEATRNTWTVLGFRQDGEDVAFMCAMVKILAKAIVIVCRKEFARRFS